MSPAPSITNRSPEVSRTRWKANNRAWNRVVPTIIVASSALPTATESATGCSSTTSRTPTTTDDASPAHSRRRASSMPA